MSSPPGPSKTGKSSTATEQSNVATPAPPSQQAALVGDAEEENDTDDDSAFGDERDSTASLSSSILNHRVRHGRTFAAKGDYHSPNDVEQNTSLDMGHHVVLLAFDEKLFLAPVDKPQRILDVGTGSGIWAMDVADSLPESEVIGTDISPNQPSWVPPNLSFQVDDVSQPWTWGSNAFDFVHLRFLVGCFTDADWSGLYKEAYNALKPGGWIEHTEWSLDIRNDEQSLDPIMLKWRDVFIEAGPKTGRSFEVIEKRDGWLKDAGFPEITKKRFQLPLGDWPADPKLKEIGKFNLAHINIGLDGYARFLCETVLGWKPEEVTVLVAGVRRALKKRGTYFYMESVYAQKPSP